MNNMPNAPELEKTVLDLDQNQAAPGDIDRRMEEFLSIAGHEFRTPLTSIRANIQLARRQLEHIAVLPAEEAVTHLSYLMMGLERAERQAGRLNQLVSDLLDVSRIQAGHLEMRLASGDLREIVREVILEQRLNYPERDILMRVPKQSVPVNADSERIGQAITNLLANAIQYSPEEKPIDVATRAFRRCARIEVRDHGPGLPPREQALIWERFHQAPGVAVLAGSHVGFGIGLYITKSIVERHHGSVGVQSQVGRGSTFWLRLPVAR